VIPEHGLRNVRRFAIARAFTVTGWQLVSVAVGWQLYERTRDPWSLGLVGLVELIPVIFLIIPAGIAADRFPRRNVAMLGAVLFGLAALGLILSSDPGTPLPFTYGCLLLVGVSRSFIQPAQASYLPELAPPAALARVNAWIAASFEIAAIGGPALAGLLIAATKSAALAFGIAALCQVVYLAILLTLPARRPVSSSDTPHSAREIFAGLHFIRRTPVFLAAITLDLLAVLVGGAVALLPVYAKDILQVGPTGLGWLRTAPAVGSLLMSLAVTRMKPWERPGRLLLTVVIGFGLATIGFGLSRNFVLSLLCLSLVGATDTVSVIIRMTLEQTITPDALRGRVSSINFLFVGFSNELGSFESGAAAALFGPVAAVVGGGIASILIVGIVAMAWPQLARIGPLHTLSPERPMGDPRTIDNRQLPISH
jgi:MFS family permease